ncbi:hypothetical protein LEP1GSC062_0131, partial [Leptospira alexanderi serovar Manhao 3 str. L 60]
MGLRAILIISIVSFNLLTIMFRPAGRNIELPESPVSEKGKRISKVEYNRTLKYERYFLRKPPSFLTPNSYLLAPKYTSANNADARDSDNVSAASQSAQSQSQSAGMVVDLIKSVALGGMSPQAWAQGQVKQMA